MPQDSRLIVTKSPNADVLVFNYEKHSSLKVEEECKPEARLVGHTEEGYGLDWSPLTRGRVLSGGNDKMICMWDINPEAVKGAICNAVNIFASHTDIVAVSVGW